MEFGTLEDTTAPNNRKVVIFKKRTYSTLSEECQMQLKRAKICEGAYSALFKLTPGQNGHNSSLESQVILTGLEK